MERRALIYFLIFFMCPIKTYAQWSFDIPLIGLHGNKVEKQRVRLMPNKLDDNGYFVFTPGIFINYKLNDFSFTTGFFKDSHLHNAIPLVVSYRPEITNNLEAGIGFGGYIRETHERCYEEMKVCVIGNDFGVVKAGEYDLVPMVGLDVVYKIEKTRLRVFSNGFLSMFSIGMDF